MKIKVTQKHIDEGIKLINLLSKGSHDRVYLCPIALALKDQTKRTWAVDICIASWDGDVSPYYEEFRLSKIAIRKIKSFDKGCNIKPFEFEFPYKKTRRKK